MLLSRDSTARIQYQYTISCYLKWIIQVLTPSVNLSRFWTKWKHKGLSRISLHTQSFSQ